MERLHPGVYIEEVSSGVRPIEGVSTSTAAFIGKAAKGAIDRAVMVTSYLEFERTYGGFLDDSYLAHAAQHFFINGGQRLYVVRVAKNAQAANVAIADRKASPAKTLTISANSPGNWGNDLNVMVTDGTLDPADEFDLTVVVNNASAEFFPNLTMNPDATNFVEKVVASSQYIVAAADPSNTSSDAGKSVSGVGPAVNLTAITDKRKLVIDITGDGPQTITIVTPCGTGAEIAARIADAVHALAPLKGTTPLTTFSSFMAVYDPVTTKYTLTSGVAGKLSSVRVTNAPLVENAAALLKLGTSNGGSETTGAAVLRPANGTYSVGDGVVGGNVISVLPGKDGDAPGNNEHIEGFNHLNRLTDVNVIAVPGIGTIEVVSYGSNYCSSRMDCFYIGDMTIIDDEKDDALTYANTLTGKTSYAAVYFPWLKTLDPKGGASPILVPPSGFVAGIYARTDARRGVWKAPAGTEASVGGVIGLATNLTDVEQGPLNRANINVIRQFPSAGVVVWGARTIGSDAEYRYIPIRRLAMFIERSIYNGIQWAVFEPNDEDLWSSLRLNIGAFMMNLFRAGAFQGKTPAQAFFVKCDAQTNPQSEINLGIVNVLVGFAPLRPAEFVVIKISQKNGDSAS